MFTFCSGPPERIGVYENESYVGDGSLIRNLVGDHEFASRIPGYMKLVPCDTTATELNVSVTVQLEDKEPRGVPQKVNVCLLRIPSNHVNEELFTKNAAVKIASMEVSFSEHCDTFVNEEQKEIRNTWTITGNVFINVPLHKGDRIIIRNEYLNVNFHTFAIVATVSHKRIKQPLTTTIISSSLLS